VGIESIIVYVILWTENCLSAHFCEPLVSNVAVSPHECVRLSYLVIELPTLDVPTDSFSRTGARLMSGCDRCMICLDLSCVIFNPRSVPVHCQYLLPEVFPAALSGQRIVLCSTVDDIPWVFESCALLLIDIPVRSKVSLARYSPCLQ
jgi:hypothetical protein